MSDLPSNLTVPEVAAELRIHKATVYRMVESGILPAIRVGVGRQLVRIPRAAFEAYKAEAEGVKVSAGRTFKHLSM